MQLQQTCIISLEQEVVQLCIHMLLVMGLRAACPSVLNQCIHQFRALPLT